MVEIVTRRCLSGTMGQKDENHDCHTKINAVSGVSITHMQIHHVPHSELDIY